MIKIIQIFISKKKLFLSTDKFIQTLAADSFLQLIFKGLLRKEENLTTDSSSVVISIQEWCAERNKFTIMRQPQILKIDKAIDFRASHQKRRLKFQAAYDKRTYQKELSILDLVERFLLDINNLRCLREFERSSNFEFPVTRKNFKLDLLPEDPSFSSIQVVFRIQIRNVNKHTIVQWNDWVYMSPNHTNLKTQMTAIPQMTSKNINGHQLVIVNNQKPLFSKSLICAISGKKVNGLAFRCESCDLTIRAKFIDNPNLPICKTARSNNVSLNNSHDQLYFQRSFHRKICHHSGKTIQPWHEYLICLDCDKTFKAKYEKLLIDNCHREDIYQLLQPIDTVDYCPLTNFEMMSTISKTKRKGSEVKLKGELIEITKLIGQGDFSNVYEAKNTTTHESFALKIQQKRLILDKQMSSNVMVELEVYKKILKCPLLHLPSSILKGVQNFKFQKIFVNYESYYMINPL